MNSQFEVSENTLKIEAFLRTLNPGERVTFKQIESETGVKMDNRGRANMRSALNRLKLEHSPIRGIGIELCSEKNAAGIVAEKVIRIEKCVKRARKTTTRVTEQFFDKLPEEQKISIAATASALGTIIAVSRGATLIYKKPERKAIN